MRTSRSASQALTRVELAAAALAVAMPVEGQPRAAGVLEEIVVTATRVETNLQQTPMSVQAWTGEELELAGIDAGRELGIMVPNVVLNPGRMGELESTMIVRGLPGVTTYFDGMASGTAGFLQRSFVELERVEVLRGPQGTLFGRNTNGGAIQMITRPPADALAARVGAELGSFDRRRMNVAIDAPVNERIKTKWTAASEEIDGFLDSRAGPFSLGDSDDYLLRGDLLWEPTETFALRVTLNREQRHSSDGRIVRITNPSHPTYIAYNVLAGNPDYLAQARAVDPGFPDPPLGLATDRFTAESHESGFPGGELGRWETRSDTPGPTTIADVDFVTMTLDWDFIDRWSLESLTTYQRADTLQISDPDASELTFLTQAGRSRVSIETQEFHVTGEQLGGRLQILLGLWYSSSEGWFRPHQWSAWEFAIPNTGPNPGTPGPPGTDGRPLINGPALAYVNAWGATVGNGALATYFPATFLTADTLQRNTATEDAVFGQLRFALTDRVNLTLGFRRTSDDTGTGSRYLPADAFRPTVPGTLAAGDPYAVAALLDQTTLADLGSVTSPRVSLSYEPTDDIYVYMSYAEGFTSGEILHHALVADPIVLDPEIVETRELGIRSDLLRGRLRVNATYFDSVWDGLRVLKSLNLTDPNTGAPLPFAVPSSDGVAATKGLELELDYLPGERWEIDLSIGFLDSEYLNTGDPTPGGLQSGTPFAYAPDRSYSLGVRYRWPLRRGAELLVAGNYGWMDEYQRSANPGDQPKNADGSNKPEPAYGLLNARVVYSFGNRPWQLMFFGTNLTNEWYVNGGSDFGLLFGFDRVTIGRPRELGVGFRVTL